MSVDWVRRVCLSLPHVTENVQWGYDLVFKVAGKMFAVTPLEPAPHALSFKCTPEEFATLVERPGIVPAPYMARASWVALETFGACRGVNSRDCCATLTRWSSRSCRRRRRPRWRSRSHE